MKYPISPEYIQAAGEYLTPLYQSLEDYVIEKICEQFQTGEANATALELIRELQRRGLDLKDIEKRIRKVLGISVKELENIFQDAVTRNEAFYGEAIDKMGLVGETYQMEAMRLEAGAIARQTMGEFVNLTQSMGFAMQDLNGQTSFFPIKEAYQKALDKAAVQVLSGADSYNVAIEQAVRSLTDSGLQTVDYESGHHDRVDVAVRRAVMTGVVQISSKYTEQMAEDIPTPYREVSAHSGARDKGIGWQNHKAWQGKVYSMRAGDKYPSIYAVCGWGEVDGLEGANCRHMHYPFWDGISEPSYTDEELAQLDPPPFEYQGKKYTRYEATQQQRKIERALRAVKRRMIGEKAAGQTDAYTTSAIKYRRLEAEYNAFTKASGLRSQRERSYIKEFGPKDSREAIKSANAYHSDWLKSINAQNTSLNSIDKYYVGKYNSTPEFQLLHGYSKAVNKGDISPLVGFDKYKAVNAEISAKLVGKTTPSGVKINGCTTHFIDRVIGQTSTPHKGMRLGVSVDKIEAALQNGVPGKIVTNASGQQSQQIIGKDCVFTINPKTGILIQVNPKV